MGDNLIAVDGASLEGISYDKVKKLLTFCCSGLFFAVLVKTTTLSNNLKNQTFFFYFAL